LQKNTPGEGALRILCHMRLLLFYVQGIFFVFVVFITFFMLFDFYFIF
jgi:hypothetical protein